MSATGMSESPTAEPVRANHSSRNCRSLSGPKRPTPRTSWSVRLAAARYHRRSAEPTGSARRHGPSGAAHFRSGARRARAPRRARGRTADPRPRVGVGPAAATGLPARAAGARCWKPAPAGGEGGGGRGGAKAVAARQEDPAALGGRGLVVLLPEDADARDAAEGA